MNWKDQCNAVKAALETYLDTLPAPAPDRIVSRKYVRQDMIPVEDLLKGKYTLISQGESDYKNYNGREAMDGQRRLLIIYQFTLAPIGGAEADGEAVEDHESAIVEEVKGFVRQLPPDICCLLLQEVTQSGQVIRPAGWLAFDFLLDCVDD